MFGYNVENEVPTLLSLGAVLSLTPQESDHKVHPDLDVSVLLPLPQPQLCGVPVPTPCAAVTCCGSFLSPLCSSVSLGVMGLLMPPQRSRWSLLLSHFSYCHVLALSWILMNPTLSLKIRLLLSVQTCCCSGYHSVVSLFPPYIPHRIPSIAMALCSFWPSLLVPVSKNSYCSLMLRARILPACPPPLLLSNVLILGVLFVLGLSRCHPCVMRNLC